MSYKHGSHFVTSSVWDLESAKFKIRQMPFVANLPKFMPINISNYTVFKTCIHVFHGQMGNRHIPVVPYDCYNENSKQYGALPYALKLFAD